MKYFKSLVKGMILFFLITEISGSVPPALASNPTSVDPKPLSADVIVVQVDASTDDVKQNDFDGVFISGTPSLPLGQTADGGQLIGVRFNNITIPQGSTISQAYLSFTAFDDRSGSTGLFINGHNVGDSPAFSSGDSPQARLSQATGAETSWTPGDWVSGMNYSTPDLSGILQEIILRPDWASGNSVSLIIRDDGVLNGVLRRAVAYDSSPAEAPRLTIEFTSSSSLSNPFNPGLFVNNEVQILSEPDLVITNLSTNQPGYQECSDWSFSAEVTNIGGSNSGPFFVTFGLGRIQGPVIFFSNSVASNSYSITFAQVPNLAAGEGITVNGPGTNFDNFCEWTSTIFGLPLHSQAFIGAMVDGSFSTAAGQSVLINTLFQQVIESNEDNNFALTTFIYPNSLQGDSYDPALDGDGDGYYPSEGDCNDENPLVHPDAEEVAGDFIDNNCDGYSPYYNNPGEEYPPGWSDQRPAGNETDYDQDGFAFVDGDCNDINADIYPGALETQNGLDDDCDGIVDEGFLSPDYDNLDLDGDGYSISDGDCDDFQSNVNPGAPEILDGVDNDCDGIVDEWFLTPDWTISEFIVERDNFNCFLYSQPENWGLSDCGLDFTVHLENLGEDIGPNALRTVSEALFITDLVQQYPLDSYHQTLGGRAFLPYHVFSTPSLIDLMACGTMGFLAVIPSEENGGILGEENTSNNWALATLDNLGTDIDIVFDNPLIRYPNVGNSFPGENGLGVIPRGTVNGSCPPPELVDYSTRVRIFLNGNQLFENEVELSRENSSDDFGLQFDSRPSNGDQIVVEMLLNSDNLISENTDNNLCVVTFGYDHADFLGPWRNDILVPEEIDGCTATYIGGGESTPIGVGSVSSGLSSPPPNPGIILAGVILVGLLGGVFGWRTGIRLGISKGGLAGIILGGAFLGGILGGESALLGVRAFNNPDQPALFSGFGGEPADLGVLTSLFDDVVNEGDPLTCIDLLTFNSEAVLDDEGEAVDVMLGVQPSGNPLPPESRYLFSVWDKFDTQQEFVTENEFLSLKDVGLFPDNLDNSFLWQALVESPAGGGSDLFLIQCFPEQVQLFSPPDEPSKPGDAEGDITPTFTPTLTPTVGIIFGASPTSTATSVPIALPTSTFTPVPPADKAGPKVSGPNASPNPAFTTSKITISATVNDPAGIKKVTVYLKPPKGSYAAVGQMKLGGGSTWSLGDLGPFTAGTYEFRILAEDNLGNTNCSAGNPGACPGGSIVVNLAIH